tara:strand:- start:7574 stop:8245 length:672 start_codon:yes stop_codon:yes gene_type:complete
MKVLRMMFFSFLSFVAEAIDLSPQKVLTMTLSSKSLNRLSLKGDGVRDIFLYPGDAAEYVTLHKSGDIFISPQPKGTTFSMTIMGGKAGKQDLEIVFDHIKARPIVLEEKGGKGKPALEILGQLLVNTMHQDQEGTETLLPALFEAKVRQLGDITIENVGGFNVDLGGETLSITKALIQNHGSVPYVFTPEDIRDVAAVSATFENLKPEASGFIYFINKQQEK